MIIILIINKFYRVRIQFISLNINQQFYFRFQNWPGFGFSPSCFNFPSKASYFSTKLWLFYRWKELPTCWWFWSSWFNLSLDSLLSEGSQDIKPKNFISINFICLKRKHKSLIDVQNIFFIFYRNIYYHFLINLFK